MRTDFERAVATRLRVIREELQMLPREVGLLLGISRDRWNNWEMGNNLPNEKYMVKLCRATGVTLDYVYMGKLAGVPIDRAIRLAAREQGLNPDDPRFRPEAVAWRLGTGTAGARETQSCV